MACGCQGGKRAAAVATTYRVLVNGTQVYENSLKAPAEAVAKRYGQSGTATVKLLSPGETA